MRAGLRGVGLLAVTGALVAAAVSPASAAESATWQPDLSAGEGTGVVVVDGTARFDADTAVGAPAEDPSEAGEATPGDATESSADPAEIVPTGLLTLPSRPLDRPTTEVDSTLVTDAAPGSTAGIDVRGKRADGGWTEWIPATPGDAPGSGRTELPRAVDEVQGRIVLTSTGGTPPTVRGVTLSAAPASESEAESDPMTEAGPRSYSVFATREGLVGGTTANGHKIANRDRFVALPSRRALSPNGKSDYSVKVCAPNKRCAFAPVWDIGPWNTQDDYWNPSPERQRFKDLPQGVPQAQAAFRNGHNGGKDQFGRRPANPAGIDLGDGIFWDALGLKDNSQVQVDYLWTGSVRLSTVSTEGSEDEVDVHASPDAGSPVVGIAADSADVPVECTQGTGEQAWLRIGEGQYIPANAVESAPTDVPACGPAAPADSPATLAAPSAPSAPGDKAGDAVATDPPADSAGESAGEKAADKAGAAQKATGPATDPTPGPADKTTQKSTTSDAPGTGTSTADDPTTSAPAEAPGPASPTAPAAPTDAGTRQAATPGTGAAQRAPSVATP
ncbi:hypothetical protein [Pseudonocardia sediminis]|nr:hypothetical protein [Pseudonocardia sediminis]